MTDSRREETDRCDPVRPGCTRHIANGSRKVHLFSDSGSDDGEVLTCDISPYFSYEGSGGIPQPGRGSCSLSEQFPDYGAVPEGTCFCKEGRYKIIYVAPERLETARVYGFCYERGYFYDRSR